jgi:hypothetical protein
MSDQPRAESGEAATPLEGDNRERRLNSARERIDSVELGERLDVAAGDVRVAFSPEDDDPDIVVRVDIVKPVAERGPCFLIHRVPFVRIVDGQRSYSIRNVEQDLLRHQWPYDRSLVSR